MKFALFVIVFLAVASISSADGSLQNNNYAAEATLKPDYVVTTITPSTNQIVKDQAKEWFIRTENNGTAKTNKTSVTRVFVDGKWLQDIPLYALGTYPPSPPDYQIYTFDGMVMITCTENRNYTVTAIADANEEIDELGEGNNAYSTSIECVDPPAIPANELPDYAITSYKVPSTWVVNKSVLASLDVTNLGAKPSNITWTLNYSPVLVSWDFFYRGASHGGDPQNIPSLNPGQTFHLSTNLICNKPGQFDILLLINYVHFLLESDYSNDFVVIPVTCVLSSAQNTTTGTQPAPVCPPAPKEISCTDDIAQYGQLWNDSSGCPVKCRPPSLCKDGKPIEVECNQTAKETSWMEKGCSYKCKPFPPKANESSIPSANEQKEQQTQVIKPSPEPGAVPVSPIAQKGPLDAFIDFILSLLGMK